LMEETKRERCRLLVIMLMQLYHSLRCRVPLSWQG
jgi:hypothetical protein